MTAKEKFKILLVEDNPGDADLAREHISSIPDYDFEVTHAARLAEAVVAMQNDEIDAVLLDLNLPDSQGIATLKRLRAIRSATAIIVLSGSRDERLQEKVLQEGAQEFLSKDDPVSLLIARSFHHALERRRMEEERKRIERLVQTNPDAMIVVDGTEIVRFANEAALKLFGKTSETFVGMPLGHDMHEGGVVEFAFERDGQSRAAEMRATAFEWEGRHAYLASIRDVTEQKQLSEQLMQAQKMEAIGLLAGGIAHDFNNLLTVIINSALCAQTVIGETSEAAPDVARILNAADRAEILIAELLSMARRKPVKSRATDLTKTVKTLQTLLRRTLPANIELVTEISPGLWPALIDNSRIEQVLMNLVVNARDAMPKGGTLTISLDNTGVPAGIGPLDGGDYIRIDVSDTGCGIAAEHLGRIFDPFFTTKAPGKGTGLGLATTYALVRQMGGDISVNSTVGEGTTFSILVPRTEAQSEPAPKEQEAAKDTGGGHEHILVVEDDDDVRDMLVQLLERNGYQVTSAEDGEEGLEIAESRRGEFDLVLSDIVMPKLSGRELKSALAASQGDVRVLLMSGYSEAGIDTPYEEETDILHKPFRPLDLLKAVRAALDEGKNAVNAA